MFPVVKARTNKVVCYIVAAGHLVVFTHRDVPLDTVGVQVPAGTITPGEVRRVVDRIAMRAGLDRLAPCTRT